MLYNKKKKQRYLNKGLQLRSILDRKKFTSQKTSVSKRVQFMHTNNKIG